MATRASCTRSSRDRPGGGKAYRRTTFWARARQSRDSASVMRVTYHSGSTKERLDFLPHRRAPDHRVGAGRGQGIDPALLSVGEPADVALEFGEDDELTGGVDEDE